MKRKRYLAGIAYAEHGTFAAAGDAVNVSERTVRRWADAADFQEGITDGKREAIREATRRLSQAGVRATETLTGIMEDKNVPPGVRVRAATSILSALVHLTEFEDFDRRLSALEQAL